MSKAQDFPVIFNIGGSNRHEVILINTGFSIEEISKKVESLVSESVNCQEPLSKYKKKGEPEKVASIKVNWSTEGRDTRLFPKSTILTGDNTEAILMLLDGKFDILEIDIQGAPPAEDSATEQTQR
ncbi:hypothetical protein BDV97DRAFT_373536 [Delphinella strobiligena]|nr:hypothetical protein BDV97DRAFT_373536 [Delphinella strobiligena]